MIMISHIMYELLAMWHVQSTNHAEGKSTFDKYIIKKRQTLFKRSILEIKRACQITLVFYTVVVIQVLT